MGEVDEGEEAKERGNKDRAGRWAVLLTPMILCSQYSFKQQS